MYVGVRVGMLTDKLELVRAREGDSEALESLLSAALHSPDMSKFLALLGINNLRELRLRGELVAGFGYVPMGQWFGGANVPSVGISVVGVGPGYRRSGVGSAMLRLMLDELHQSGVPLSSLYPATVPFYQRAGYERAGYRITYEVPLDAIDVREAGLEMVPFTEKDYPTIHDLYDRRARLSSGHLDRPAWMWKVRLESEERKLFRYLISRDGVPEGYIVYSQGDIKAPITLEVCVLTPDAGRRVLTFLAGHRSMIEYATWTGGPLDPLVYLLREPLVGVMRPRVKIVRSMDWMLRLLDVPKALSLRGYPPGLSAKLHLDVRDDSLPSNNGRIVLEVGGGRGEVRLGGEGRISAHVRDLAALYSGFMSPAELLTLGTLVASDADLALLGAVFAGPRPWMPDMF
jgi:predicted acetyltransferase